MTDDIGVAHWAAQCDGGGERVAWELGRTFDAPVLLGERDRGIEPEDIQTEAVFDSKWLDRIRKTPLRVVGDLLAWERADRLREFDTLVTSGNPTLRYVPSEEQTWVAYIHHTRREETDRLDAVLDASARSLVWQTMAMGQRMLHQQATCRPDLLVANSEVVKERMVRYWGVDRRRVRVVYPPVATTRYDPAISPTEDYYLYVGRLAANKRVAELAGIFTELFPDRQLKIAGDGPERDRVERVAGANVDVLGYVDEDRKRGLLSGARGFVMPADAEDFGIAPIEALASGTPVVGVREGFTRHQVRDGVTGWTWTRRDEPGRSVGDALDELETVGVRWSPIEIANWAGQFSVDRFREEMRSVVCEARERHGAEPDLFGQVAAQEIGPEPGVDRSAVADGGDSDAD